jgi:hypothetical protein
VPKLRDGAHAAWLGLVMGDNRRHDPPPLHFGDYPNGAYWSAEREDSETVSDELGVPPLVKPVPRSPANPYPIDMFVDGGLHSCLWGVWLEQPPTTNGVHDPHCLENELPISVSLRDRLLAWAADGDRLQLDPDREDRGFLLSRELQRELGDLYSVTYHVEYAHTDRVALQAIADSDPLPGWQFK